MNLSGKIGTWCSKCKPLPDYLQDTLCDTSEKLRKEILKEPHEPTTS